MTYTQNKKINSKPFIVGLFSLSKTRSIFFFQLVAFEKFLEFRNNVTLSNQDLTTKLSTKQDVWTNLYR